MSNVRQVNFGGNGGEPPMSDLELRVVHLEQDVTEIKADIKNIKSELSELKTDVAVIKSNYATKDDVAAIRTEVHQAITAQTKWLAGLILGGIGLTLTCVKLFF